VVVVEDDGVGFNPAAARAGVGLLGMQERVQELEGKIFITSRKNGGTKIRVEMPAGVLA
jgi:signal transduction histidine kinase